MNLNNDNEKRDQPSDDLDWLAFCYVTDELDAESRAAFEQRLATDVVACEAVADAVQLSSLVYEVAEADDNELVELPAHPSEHLEHNQPAKWSLVPTLVFAASVMMCLLAAGWIWNNSLDSQPTVTQQAGAQQTPDVNQLATTWADAFVDDGNDFESVILTTGTESVFGELDDAGSDDSWLLVALADMEDGQ